MSSSSEGANRFASKENSEAALGSLSGDGFKPIAADPAETASVEPFFMLESFIFVVVRLVCAELEATEDDRKLAAAWAGVVILSFFSR